MSFFNWQDGNQGVAGDANIPSSLYNPSTDVDNSKVEWACAPSYPPDNCPNKNIKWVPKQIQSLLSNLYSAISCLALFKANDQGFKEVVNSCDNDVSSKTLGDLLCYFIDKAVTKKSLPDEMAKLLCAQANDNSLTVTPPSDAVFFFVQKGANPSDPCTLGATTIAGLYCQLPLVPMMDYQTWASLGFMWSTNCDNARIPIIDYQSGATLGYGYATNTAHPLATNPVNSYQPTGVITAYIAH